jgi:hypothetical protein
MDCIDQYFDRKRIEMVKESSKEFQRPLSLALSLAVEKGRADVVSVLLQEGADPDGKGLSCDPPIILACKSLCIHIS